MQIDAKLEGITSEKKRITRKNIDGTKSDDVETITTMKLALKKVKLDSLENVKEGTGDPWARFSISSYDPKVFDDFKQLPMGSHVVVVIEAGE
jgi:hypothetical protein